MIPTDQVRSTETTAEVPAAYLSSNLRKHTSRNPVQRFLIGQFHSTARELLAQTTPHTILDAGCGEGFAMHEIFEHMRAVVGVDTSVTALQIASRINTHQRFVGGDLLALPFRSQSFDLVACMEVLEHLPDPQSGLKELCRVSNQWLLLSVPHEPFFRGANFLRGKNIRAWGNDPGHLNHWSASGFIRFVASHCRVICWRLAFPWTLVLCSVT